MLHQRVVIGVDEVGRGALAGPLTVAAVVFLGAVPPRIIGWNGEDSKRLTPKRRLRIAESLRTHAQVRYAISSVSNRTIDRLGMTRAAFLAVTRALQRLQLGKKFPMPLVLLDGGLRAPFPLPQVSVVSGDSYISSIAAASIVAKVHRDRFMERQQLRFPQYAFAVHKGYGTAAHYRALRQHGFSPLHRKSFRLA